MHHSRTILPIILPIVELLIVHQICHGQKFSFYQRKYQIIYDAVTYSLQTNVRS